MALARRVLASARLLGRVACCGVLVGRPWPSSSVDALGRVDGAWWIVVVSPRRVCPDLAMYLVLAWLRDAAQKLVCGF